MARVRATKKKTRRGGASNLAFQRRQQQERVRQVRASFLQVKQDIRTRFTAKVLRQARITAKAQDNIEKAKRQYSNNDFEKLYHLRFICHVAGCAAHATDKWELSRHAGEMNAVRCGKHAPYDRTRSFAVSVDDFVLDSNYLNATRAATTFQQLLQAVRPTITQAELQQYEVYWNPLGVNGREHYLR